MSRDNWEKIKYKIGEGLYSDSSEEEYFGEIKNGLPDGEGIYKTSNMEDHHRVIRKGEFRKGKLVEGTEEVIIGDSKSHYEGEFRDGFQDGIGKKIRYHEDGTTTVCEGEFRRGRLDGEGKKIWDFKSEKKYDEFEDEDGELIIPDEYEFMYKINKLPVYYRSEQGEFKNENFIRGVKTFEDGSYFTGYLIDKHKFKGTLHLHNDEYIFGTFNDMFVIQNGEKRRLIKNKSTPELIESYKNSSPNVTKKLFKKFIEWNRP